MLKMLKKVEVAATLIGFYIIVLCVLFSFFKVIDWTISKAVSAPLENTTKINNITRKLPTEPAIDLLPLPLNRQAMCIALAIYKEARGLPEQSMYLVALTIKNREEKQNKDACQIIVQPYQFPWAASLSPNWQPKESKAWSLAQYVAFMSMYSTKYTPPNCRIYFFNSVLVASHKKVLGCMIKSGLYYYATKEHN